MVFISSNPPHSSPSQEATHKRVSFCVGIDAISSVTPAPRRIVLPPVESDDFVSQRHEVNPALALNLLGDIQTKVSLWQQQQRQIVQAMQMLHAQGPMVDGWLQSSLHAAMPPNASDATSAATLLRHGDTEALMQYVAALEGASQAGQAGQRGASPAGSNGCASELAGRYSLCTLSDEGHVRSQPCPPEQMAMVSKAIARYQKFKQLALQKQTLQAKLQQAVDSLTCLRATLQQS